MSAATIVTKEVFKPLSKRKLIRIHACQNGAAEVLDQERIVTNKITAIETRNPWARV